MGGEGLGGLLQRGGLHGDPQQGLGVHAEECEVHLGGQADDLAAHQLGLGLGE
ncbi:hypothetical protein [Streptomyces sp. NPDC002758]